MTNNEFDPVAPETANVTVTGNTALDNATWDCQDESGPAGGGVADIKNTWQDNVGRTDSPDGLCAAPAPTTAAPGHDKPHHKHKKKQKRHEQPDPCTCTRFHPRAI